MPAPTTSVSTRKNITHFFDSTTRPTGMLERIRTDVEKASRDFNSRHSYDGSKAFLLPLIELNGGIEIMHRRVFIDHGKMIGTIGQGKHPRISEIGNPIPIRTEELRVFEAKASHSKIYAFADGTDITRSAVMTTYVMFSLPHRFAWSPHIRGLIATRALEGVNGSPIRIKGPLSRTGWIARQTGDNSFSIGDGSSASTDYHYIGLLRRG